MPNKLTLSYGEERDISSTEAFLSIVRVFFLKDSFLLVTCVSLLNTFSPRFFYSNTITSVQEEKEEEILEKNKRTPFKHVLLS